MEVTRCARFDTQSPRIRIRGLSRAIAFPLFILWLSPALTCDAQDILLITRDAPRRIEPLQITADSITFLGELGGTETLALDECIGLINPHVVVAPRGTGSPSAPGILVLADGQRLPGRPILGVGGDADVLVWKHNWLHRISTPLEKIAWTGFDATAQPPRANNADMVLLTNGDLVEGFVVSMGDPIQVEQDGSLTSIALDRVRAVRLITPPAAPAPDTRRIWFEDATVVDVAAVMMGEDDQVHFVPPLGESTSNDMAKPLTLIAGILFDQEAMIAFGSMSPHDVEGPATRYETPAPEIDPREKALDLADVLLRGPLTARYALPAGAVRITGAARLEEDAGEWGDCELVIAVDGREVLRELLHSDRRRLDFDVSLDGAELSIEISEGAHGPIGDHVVIEQAMFIIES